MTKRRQPAYFKKRIKMQDAHERSELVRLAESIFIYLTLVIMVPKQSLK